MRESLGITKPKGELKEKVCLFRLRYDPCLDASFLALARRNTGSWHTLSSAVKLERTG